MSAHTPGPWHVYRGRNIDHIWRRNRTVAAYPQGKEEYGDMALAYCDYHTPEIAEANARLIAAAPDMLKALKAVEEWWLSEGMTNATGAPYAIFATRAIIAKAEGSSAELSSTHRGEPKP